MKIIKVIDKKKGNVVYYKYRIIIPKDIVDNNNFLDQKLIIKFDKNKDRIIIEKEINQGTKELSEKEIILQKEFLKLIGKK